jgi:hypothetical protein
MFSRDYYLQGMIVTTDLSENKASLRLSAVKEYYNDSEVNKGFLLTLWCYGEYDFSCIFSKFGDAQQAFGRLAPHAKIEEIKQIFGENY